MGEIAIAQAHLHKVGGRLRITQLINQFLLIFTNVPLVSRLLSALKTR